MINYRSNRSILKYSIVALRLTKKQRHLSAISNTVPETDQRLGQTETLPQTLTKRVMKFAIEELCSFTCPGHMYWTHDRGSSIIEFRERLSPIADEKSDPPLVLPLSYKTMFELCRVWVVTHRHLDSRVSIWQLKEINLIKVTYRQANKTLTNTVETALFILSADHFRARYVCNSSVDIPRSDHNGTRIHTNQLQDSMNIAAILVLLKRAITS